jgi:acetyltransferase-like isoleucine patch superfamily enzyme
VGFSAQVTKLVRLLRYDWPAHFVLLLTNWLPDNVPFLAFRGALLRPFLASCGKDLRLGRNVTFYNPSAVRLGRDVYIAYGTWFMAGAVIEVGNEVLFGPYCVIVSSEHSREGRSFRFGKGRTAPIVIHDGCWLAAHVTVTAGVTIGASSIAAAGAVVTEDVPEGTIVGGVPARVIRHLAEP